jgi:RNA polymerase sigma factor (sigma-70 family)
LEWIFVGDYQWLNSVIRRQRPCQQTNDEHELDDLVRDVLLKLYLVILRNCGTWYRVGNHKQEWRGFVMRQVERIACRLAKRVLKRHEQERPLGPAVADGPRDPFENLPDGREVSPELQAMLKEMMDQLKVDEREVFRRFLKGTPIEDIAAELGLSVYQAKNLLQRVKRTLLPLLQRKPDDA